MIIEKLKELFPPLRIITDPQKLPEYADDITDADPQVPLAVVMPDSVEEICSLVRFAGQNRIPLTPRIANLNVGGLAIASEGGIIVDLKLLDRIVSFSREDMYAVIEPGVTQAQMKDFLLKNAPDLKIGYSLSPPETSVLANCIMDGLTNYSLKCGSMSECILGMEAVLPDGSVIKTGSWAIGTIPYGRPPLPDISGLFVGWLGTTGIVTKISLALWPNHPLRMRLFILTQECRATYDVMRRLCRMETCDDIGVLSWPTGRMMLGVERPEPVKTQGEPAFFLYLDLSAECPEEMDFKRKQIKECLDDIDSGKKLFSEAFDVNDLVKAMPQMSKFQDFPADLDFLTKSKGGGLSWVGTYGPLSRISECCEAGMKIMADRGFPPAIVSRAMKGGHFGVLRFVEVFNRKDPLEIRRLRDLNKELFGLSLEYGFIQYKPPLTIIPEMIQKINPASYKLLKDLKHMLDPYRICNPGKLGL
jgi:glycolate oxidase